MDTQGISTAINTAIEGLNNLTDAAFKARNVDGMRSLTLAAKSLETAQSHIERAVKQSAPKAPKAKS